MIKGITELAQVDNYMNKYGMYQSDTGTSRSQYDPT